ncbi:MAG TPA: NAD-binding protein [Solirubrobacteraceae bacterium]|jgi:voltage-gated potassium channel
MREQTEVRSFLRQLRQLALLIAVILLAGAIALSLTEDRGLWESFQWALDTVATIGSHPPPQTLGGQIVKVLLTIVGVGTLFYGLVTVTEVFVAGHLSDLLAERRTLKAIDATSDHYIICGFGRVGRQVARDLRAAGARYVVIDDNPDNRELAAGIGVRFIEGSATDDEMLRAAGIMRARGVIACVDSDADNIFITLTAHQLRPDIAIVARAASEASESKLERAGATRVISPYRSSGSEMARFALNPQVSGVVDVAPEYRLEEIEVAEGSEGVGAQIADIRGGAIIVGVRSADGSFQPQPPSSTVLNDGDVVMVMGTLRTVQRLEALFARARTESRS